MPTLRAAIVGRNQHNTENIEHAASGNGLKCMRLGENPNMPYPPCAESIKYVLSNNNDAHSTTKYGFPQNTYNTNPHHQYCISRIHLGRSQC